MLVAASFHNDIYFESPFRQFSEGHRHKTQLAVLTGKSNQLSIPVLIKLASLICVVSIHLPHYLLVGFTILLFLRELVD